jgi:multiple sugar transport system substrate-binding protein
MRTSSTSGSSSRRQFVRRTAGTGAAAFSAPHILGGMTRAAAQTPSATEGEIPRTPSSATVDGTLRVMLKDDFHPDHNAFMRAELEAYAELNGWDIEITDVAGYVGGGDLFQKLLAGVQAGNAPDMLIHDPSVRNFVTLGLLQPVDELVAEATEAYGDPIPGAVFSSTVDDVWYAVPFFTRAGGYYVRQDVFEENGIDIIAGTEYYETMRETALAISKPDENMWGWGVTVNRSGDGNAVVQNVLFRHGSQLQDESGDIVTFNSPETVEGLKWLAATYTEDQWAPMLPPGVLAWTDTSNNEAFLAGQLAITQNAGTMYAKAVLDQVPFAGDIAFIPYPRRISDDARLDFMSDGMRFYLITDAKNPEAASDVMRHFLTPGVQERVLTISTGYALPSYTSGADNPIITGNPNAARGMEIALTDTGFYGLAWPGPVSEPIGSIGEGVFFTDMMSEIIQGRSAEEVAADYHDQFVQIFQDFGYPGE